jgi:C-terminal processing protease CtpA/Prc
LSSFIQSRYAYTENPKALPLYVVVDRETWSAAEYFAALLQDNHAATVGRALSMMPGTKLPKR